MNQKGFIAIAALIILALAILGGGYYAIMKLQGTPGGPSDQLHNVSQTIPTQPTSTQSTTSQTSITTSSFPSNYFRASTTSGTAPFTVSFIVNNNQPPPQPSCEGMSSMIEYPIDYGDGNNGTVNLCSGMDTIMHVYTKPGSYMAKLIDVCEKGGGPGCETTIGAISITVGGSSSQSISVPGMSQYTDTDFGFSFWYPSGWMVEQTAISNPGVYQGGTVTKEFTVGPPNKTPFDPGVVISEYSSPNATITDPLSCGAMGNCGSTTRYYFDIGTHTWMVQYPDGYSGEGGTAPPGTTKSADVSVNTMGGLHMLPGSSGDTIVPLTAENFLVVSNAQSQSVSVPNNQDYLVQTIVATDPSVATPETTAQQNAAIQAEAAAYAGQ